MRKERRGISWGPGSAGGKWLDWLGNMFWTVASSIAGVAFLLFGLYYWQRIESEGWPVLLELAATFLVPFLLGFGGMIIGLLIISTWDEERQRGDGASALVFGLMGALPLAWCYFALPWIAARLPVLP